MRVLHLAPHYGGGVGTSLIGIIEAIPGNHTILELEPTVDNELVLFKLGRRAKIVKIEDFFSNSIRQSTDLFIFHYWNSPVWKKLEHYPKLQIAGHLVLLHHRNFSFSGHEVESLALHFSRIVQSGFDSKFLPSDWGVIPTCRTLVKPKIVKEISSRSRAAYLGTLSFKKVSHDFFALCERLDKIGIKIDIWGKDTDAQFTSEINSYKKTNLVYQGYTKNSLSVLAEYKLLLYPLKKDHFGTTENALLEAMSVGTVPMVHDNNIERLILGEELFRMSSLSNALDTNKKGIIQKPEVLLKASRLAQQRAYSLTNLELRSSKWRAIVSHRQRSTKVLSFDSLYHSLKRFVQ